MNSQLVSIDNEIDKLVKKIELLDYVNPVNIQEQKELFYKSRYRKEPSFKYPSLNFDSFKLHRDFYDQEIEKIEDETIRQLYRDIIFNYTGLIECIGTIGLKDKFYFNSLRSFGTPNEVDVENAKFILHFKDEPKSAKMKPKYSSQDAENYFREFAKQYNFNFNFKHSSKLSAIAMVLNNTQTLVINDNHIFSQNELSVLANHEIGVHMVTTMNGLLQPLKIFSHGLPNNVETQEGLAVYSEYMSNNLTLKRLKELAYRVIAVDSLAKGYTFTRTFNMLKNQYHLPNDEAFYISLRVHRGGGFTKDYLYLTGLKKIYNFHKAGNQLDVLMTGKVSLEYYKQIEYLTEMKMAVPAFHSNIAFRENKNTNTLIDFILTNLK